MANTIKLKRGSGSDPSASDLAVGEVAIRTDEGKLSTKKDDGSVAEISGAGGGAVLKATNGIVETAATISSDHTISTNFNAMSAGPVTVSADITIPSGSVWTIV